MCLNPITNPRSVAVILNRRTLLASLGLALPAVGAEAATTMHKKKKPTHTTKTASAKTHHKTHPHAHTAPVQS
jgi:hypothetical protein